MSALTREDLDRLRCAAEHPDGEPCDHAELYFHSRCHPESPTWAVYADGALRVECAECRKVVAEVAVAGGGAR